MDVDVTDTQAHPLLRLWRRAPRYRPRIVRATILTALNKLFDIAPELLIGVAIDIVVRDSDSMVARLLGIEDREQQLLILGAATAVVWVLESLTQYLSQRIWRTLSQDLQHDLRMEAYRHVQELELAWFEHRASGRLLTILNDDVNQLERFLDVGAEKIVLTAVNVVAVGAVFVVISPLLALLAFLPIPVIIGGSLLYQRRLGPRYEAVRERAGRLGGLIGGNLGGIATIKAFGAEEREAGAGRRGVGRLRAGQPRRDPLSAGFVPLIRMAILVGFMVTLVLGGHMALNGTLEIGLYSVLVFMTQRLLWPLTELGETLDLYQRGVASIRRILDLIDVPIGVAPGAAELPALAVVPGRRRARWASTTCVRLRRRPRRCSTGCRWRSGRGRRTRSSARPARASRRSSSCCCGCTTRSRDRSPSTAWRSPTCRSRHCAARSATSGRTRSSSTGRSPRTCATARRTPTTRRCGARPSWPRRTSS